MTAAMLVLFCIACHHESEAPERIDLLAQFADTDSGQDTLRLDLGTPAAAPYLGAGWSAPATSPAGDSILWSDARKAVILTPIREPRDRLLMVRCGTLASPEARDQVVAVRVNGRRVATITIDREMHERVVMIPARFQRRGENEVAFGMRMGRGSNRLRVAYDAVRIVSPESEKHPVPSASDTTLTVPAGTSVEYFVHVPPLHPSLRFEVALPSAGATLEVTADSDGSTPETLLNAAAATTADVRLTRYADQIVRLRFSAGGAGAIALRQPELIGAGHAMPATTPVLSARPRNVILYLVDTLRADHLGCYGYQRPTSPRIDAFAQQSVRFTRALAQASWTRPATASVLTGLYPPTHGTLTLRDRLQASLPTLAELLRDRGYRTAGFVTNLNVAPAWGFQRGFDLYRYFPEDSNAPRVHVGADAIEPEVFAWLDQHAMDPFFLYLHVTDPHAPYVPPSPFAEQLADSTVSLAPDRVPARLQQLKRNPRQATDDDVRALMARYDGEIALVDTYFGRLLDELERRGLADDTMILFMADHGEEFFDHGGFEHGRTLYGELLSIPLIIRLPQHQRAGERPGAVARQIDVLPTVLDALSIPVPASVQGRSLLSRRDAADDGDEAFAQTSLGSRDLEAFVTGPWKIVQTIGRTGDVPEIYRTDDDPHERTNRQAELPVLLGYARQRLTTWAAQTPRRLSTHDTTPIDPAVIERLRALGYSP